MSRAVKQPVGQKRLTNVAIVRLKRNGQRFEIACYRNKVGDWRAGIEKDLDEVLQTTTVFSNVGKGVVAKDKNLLAAFGTADMDKICLEILAKGDLQVSDKERKAEFDNLYKDVASILVDKTLNPTNGRPYTITMLERALHDVHFNPDPKRSAKQQALEALPVLQAQFPIERARMRLRMQCPAQHEAEMAAYLASKGALVEDMEDSGGAVGFVVQVEPGVFRELHTFMQGVMQHQGRVEVLSFAVVAEHSGVDEFNTLTAAPAAVMQVQHGWGEPEQQQQQPAAESTSGRVEAPRQAGVAAVAAPMTRRQSQPQPQQAPGGDVVYARSSIAGIPDEPFASRKERFVELDQLQLGWEVELRSRGDTVEAVFFSPAGKEVGSFANARRQALQAHKQHLQAI